MASTDVIVPFFKKKGKGRPAAGRKRSTSPPANVPHTPVPSSSKSEVVLPSRKAASNLLSAGTKRTSSQRQEDDLENAANDSGPGVNWTAENSHSGAVLEILEGDEAEEMLRKKMKREDLDGGDEDVPDDGLYRGQKAYKSHLQKNKEVPKAMRVGPQRSTNSTIRTVTIVDYQPDVCKDYKETGYCGFGDTCKFLHDRGTYLQGWQLDKLAENPQKQAGDVSDDSDSDEDIPFACLICRKPYTDPIVTRCGHYFDSACAIKRFAKTPKCAACGAPTSGIFNRADKVIEKMKAKREAQAAEDNEDEDKESKGVKIEGLEQASGDEESDD